MKSLLIICLILTIGNSFAQELSADEKAVKAVIAKLFEGMQKGDSTLVRSVFHPKARLQTAFADKNGKPALAEGNISNFVKAVGTPHAEVWDERLSTIEIRIDDNLATVWANYEFYVGSKFSHAGVNAFQLFKSESGWKIIQIADTRRKK
ncbi:MAG: nuclear transport factor 2 family protein [Verrucomicrobia bacterium]|nr:nuclear transport factor 2 family protein [Cytophagales bacterium]